jgi:hypothetical protein
MRPRWLSFSATLNDEGRYAHQVEPGNPTAMCGVSMYPPTQWKPAGRKPKCQSCLTLMRRHHN